MQACARPSWGREFFSSILLAGLATALFPATGSAAGARHAVLAPQRSGATHRVSTAATITHLSFASNGGVFVVRLFPLPRGGLCSFTAGAGVIHYDASFACSGRLFAHAGRVLPNHARVTRRWTVRASVNSGARTQRFAWVISVSGRTPPTPPTGTGATPPAPAPACAPAVGAGPATSQNWAGYVLQFPSGCVTEAGGTWQVPTLNCPPSSGTASIGNADWVGVDGTTSAPYLFQTGVASECLNGVQISDAWYENIESNPPAPEMSLFPVSPGDTITASVARVSAGVWRYSIADTTTGDSSSQSLAYAGPSTSAEWIEEDPSLMNAAGSISLVALADFGTVTFTALSLNGAPPALTPADAVSLSQQQSVLATPSAPSPSGFSVTYG